MGNQITCEALGRHEGVSRRRTLQLGLALLGGGGGAFAAACGTVPRSDGSGPGGPPKEKVRLSYPMWLSPQERATVEKACEALTAKVPTIRVVTESSAERDMIAKLITTVASGAPPDLAASNDKMFTEIAMANAYADITPYLNRDRAQVDVNDYYPVYLAATKLRGKQYGLPDNAGTGVFYYNKLLFQRVGVPLPDGNWTWDTKVYQESARLYTDPVPSPVQWYEHETLVKQHVQAAVQGKETPDAALRALQDDIERTIKNFSQQE